MNRRQDFCPPFNSGIPTFHAKQFASQIICLVSTPSTQLYGTSKYGNGTNKFAYIQIFFGYFITTLKTSHLDDADRVAKAAIQRRARVGSPKDGFHDSRHRAHIVGRGCGGCGGGGTNAGQEKGEEQRCPTRQPPRHGAAAGKGLEEGA
jgi:hypothetical protein